MSKEKKMKERSCEFVSTLTAISERHNCNEEEAFAIITNLINDEKSVKQWAGIIHDKDVDEDGKLKARHCHIVILFNYPITFVAFSKAIGMPEQTISTIHCKKPHGSKMIADPGSALSYLTHRNDQTKFQYSDDLVASSKGWDWKAERDRSEKRIAKSQLGDIYDAIISGAITEFNLTEKVDCYTYAKHKKGIQSMFEYKRLQEQQNHDRDMKVVYIYGLAGSGKTTLAKYFCLQKDLSYFISGGSNDPYDGYRGEKAVIIDDARPDMFAPEEWLKILDPYTKSNVRSRYYNKNIVADYMILTSTVDIYTFFKSYPNEDPNQLYRRLTLYLVIDGDIVTAYIYNKVNSAFAEIDSFQNPVKSIVNVEKKNEDISELIEDFKKIKIEKRGAKKNASEKFDETN